MLLVRGSERERQSRADDGVARADPYTDPFRAALDSLTGFAYLISREYCFVWNWSRVRASLAPSRNADRKSVV